VDEVEHSWNRAPHAATEMNFGLHLPRPITWSNLPASTRWPKWISVYTAPCATRQTRTMVNIS